MMGIQPEPGKKIAGIPVLQVRNLLRTDNLDLSTPSGRLMMHVIGAMAQLEQRGCGEWLAKPRVGNRNPQG